MKKLMSLIALVAIVSVGSVSALTDTAYLNLQGAVGDFVSINVTPTAEATNLMLSVDQASPLVVANVVEKTNITGGYTVAVTSTNGFSFADINGVAATDYTLYYGGQEVVPSGDTATVVGSTAALSDNGITSSAGRNREVAVTYPAAAADTAAGTYEDTLTFTITGP